MGKDESQKPDTSAVAAAPAAAAAPVTIDQLLAVVREMVAANTMTPDAVREIATKATVDAYDRTSGKFWDEKLYPKISNFNPQGDKDHPRGLLVGEVHWVGFKCSESELTHDEIALVNALEPGIFHDGQWVVKDLQPGMRDREHRKLLVLFPCAQDQRGNLPSMLDMLREMTRPVAVPARV